MAGGNLNTLLGHLRWLAGGRPAGEQSDGRLLEKFALDQDEAAFVALLERHGPMVLGVCRRLLRNPTDAEDVFQATFLVLVSRPRAIAKRESVGSWLHGVAYRTAHRARQQEHQRRFRERIAADLSAAVPEEPGEALARQEVREVLDEELQRLPEKYRSPLVLCYLEGRTNAEAATHLGWPLGTVQVRLSRARALLRSRLLRRGVTLSAALVAGTAAVPSALAATTLRMAVLCAAGVTTVEVSATVAALKRGIMRTMLLSKVRMATAALVAVAVVGLAIGFFRQHLLAGGAAAPEALAEQVAPKADAERPRVVQVHPADGAEGIEPVTVIRIRFDKAMDPSRVTLSWDPRSPAGFRPRGEMRYLETTHEFILPVQLSPDVKHAITLNEEGVLPGKEKDYQGFRSEGGVAARTYRWSFRTAKLPAKDGEGPRVVSITPASDTEVSLLTPVEVTFDQPMAPLAYGLALPDESGPERRPELLGRPAYDPQRHRFTLLTRLPPNWNGQLRLEGFRGKDGAAVKPVVVSYRTLRSVTSEGLERRIRQAGQSAELKQLVEHVRKARRDLTSVSEKALSTMLYGNQSPDWYQYLDTKGSRFQMQGSAKFLGVIDDIMNMPFRIGSDGKTCWLRHGQELTSLPAKEIDEKNLLFCDPFDAAGKADADQVIRNQKLEYLGETEVRGRRCQRVRSWAVTLAIADVLTTVREWYIDAETFLPLRVEAVGSAVYSIDYTYSRVKEEIPEEEFRPEAGPDVRAQRPEPLEGGYTKRFLNVIDGSSGRMSVRWGMKGPTGNSRSGGLN
jgi:RNA polymerase sigma factor (sigma-70 family)